MLVSHPTIEGSHFFDSISLTIGSDGSGSLSLSMEKYAELISSFFSLISRPPLDPWSRNQAGIASKPLMAT